MNKIYIIDGRIKFFITEKKLISIDSEDCIKLRAPAALCLRILIDQKGKLVTHKELCHYGWEQFGMVVSLNVLHNTMFYLRKSLITVGGFDATIIESIHRRGFVFSDRINIHVINDGIPNEEKNAFEKNHESNDKEKKLHISNDNGINTPVINEEEKNKKSSEKQSKNNKNNNVFEPSGKINKSFTELLGSGITNISDNWFKKNHTQTTALTALLAIIIIYFSIGDQLYLTNEGRSISGYTHEGNYGKCFIYLQRKNNEYKKLRAMAKMSGLCNKTGYLYITNNLYSNNVSLIWCDKKADFMKQISCNSYYFTYKEEESKYE